MDIAIYLRFGAYNLLFPVYPVGTTVPKGVGMFRQIKEPFSMAKKRAKKQPKSLHYEELEQRVLFSADVVPGLDNIAAD